MRYEHKAKAAIFDMDGTIIDTMEIWDNIDKKFLGKRGKEVPPDYFKSIAAMSLIEAARHTVELFQLDENPEDILEEWLVLADKEYLTSAVAFPHVREYFLELKSHGVKIALATSAIQRFYKAALLSNDLYDFFDVTVSVDEVGVGKDKPDVYLLAMERMGLSPKDCVIFEDTEKAIRTAASTGAQVFAIHSDFPEGELENVHKINDFQNAPKLW